MARTPIKHDNRAVHSFLSSVPEKRLREKYPKIDDIVSSTLEIPLPRKLSREPLLCILRRCPIISTPTAAEATGYRYARSTIAEYAMLARMTSQAIGDYLGQQQPRNRKRATA